MFAKYLFCRLLQQFWPTILVHFLDLHKINTVKTAGLRTLLNFFNNEVGPVVIILGFAQAFDPISSRKLWFYAQGFAKGNERIEQAFSPLKNGLNNASNIDFSDKSLFERPVCRTEELIVLPFSFLVFSAAIQTPLLYPESARSPLPTIIHAFPIVATTQPEVV